MALPVLSDADRLLRCEGRYSVGRGIVPWAGLTLLLVLGGWIYGAAMGSYGARPLQSLYSALKVPFLLGAATVVVLPNFFVVNTILGLRDDLGAALRGVLAAQATVAVVLAAMAPLAVFAYASTDDYNTAIMLNGAMFAVATICGQSTLNRHYDPLVLRNPLHRIGKRAWLTLYVFVAIQLAWVLRPFIGTLHMPTRFFRENAWSNSYVEVWRQIVTFLGG
jgi:hypothetical protein